MFRSLAIGLGLTAIFATTGLNASTFYSEKVTIPYEFRVGNRALAAGEYRVEQDFGREFAYLVNLRTGQRVQVLRSNNERKPGRTRLTFETANGVRTLKKIS